MEPGTGFKLNSIDRRPAWAEPLAFVDLWAQDLGCSGTQRKPWQKDVIARLLGLPGEFAGLFVRLADREPLLIKPLLLIMDWLPTDFPVHTDVIFRERWRQKPTDLELHAATLDVAANTQDALGAFRRQEQYSGEIEAWRQFAVLLPRPFQEMLARAPFITAQEWTIIAHHLGIWPFEVAQATHITPDEEEAIAQLPPIPPGPWTTTERLQQVIAQAEARLFPEEKER